jgi:hypothetical protein
VNPFANLFMGLGAFLITAAVIYGIHAGDYEGLTLSVVVAGGALFFGGFLASAVHRARAEVGTQAAAPRPAGEEEPHVGPTIWPLVFAIASIGLVIGAISSRWWLVPGGLLFLAASIGWVLDVHRQWHHHAAEAGEAHTGPAHGTHEPAGAQPAEADRGTPSGSGVAGAASDRPGAED